MLKLGLTGSIGMGKSTTADLFRDEGVPVYDADATVHELYRGEAVTLIEEAFPGTTLNGEVDREKLSQYVVGKPKQMKKLEQIVHPLVHAKERAFIEEHRKLGTPVVLLDIPLLFEVGGFDRVDKIIVVSASAEEQRRRVLARPGMTVEKFEAILGKQIPDEDKRKRADFIIDTNHGVDSAREQIREILASLKKS
ncbi:MAG: dephospho-CoA kinase [Pseudomonadota bacterium]